MYISERPLAMILKAPFQLGHYRALWGMVRRYPDFLDNLYRFVTARGSYPYRCRVRTPVGTVAPTLFSSHDIFTVNEIFCREDYTADARLRVAVDLGSNIGISALYFLTRNTGSHVYLYEPNPENARRLRVNLAGYESRYELSEIAVSLVDGNAVFATESTGRYGTLDLDRAVSYGDPTASITVRTRTLNAVLAEVFDREGHIDILKVDTEGTEADLVASIEPRYLSRIDTICYETDKPMALHDDLFRFHYSCQTNRLTRRRRRYPDQPGALRPRARS